MPYYPPVKSARYEIHSPSEEKYYTTLRNAHELAERIKDYWLSRTGRNPFTVVIEQGFHPTARHSMFVVRSSMVNGYPPGHDPRQRKR